MNPKSTNKELFEMFKQLWIDELHDLFVVLRERHSGHGDGCEVNTLLRGDF